MLCYNVDSAVASDVFKTPTFLHVCCLEQSSFQCLIYLQDIFFLGIAKHDKEGRVITAEYEKFYFVTACKCRCYHFFTSNRI